MSRRSVWIGLVVVVLAGVGIASWRVCCQPPVEPSGSDAAPPAPRSEAEIRQALFDAIQPVRVNNCDLARFGEPNDGGYLMCGNLLGDVKAGYSYGIDGYDGWGCQVSDVLSVPVHQYDCFNTTLPTCVANTTFHAECVGPSVQTIDGRLFDTIENQLKKNGNALDHVVMKMDIEGAEWDSLLYAPDAVLAQIDQIAIEFHRINEEKFVQVIEGLKRTFHVAHLHFNNHSCVPGLDPFPAWAFELLLVNKRIARVDDPPVPAPGLHPLDAPAAANVPDCQAIAR